MNSTVAAITCSGWSRCGEWPQSGSSSSRVAGTRRAMPRICSSVPYSSSMPWMASSGQRMRLELGLDVPGAERPGPARCRFQPQKAESTSSWWRARRCAQVGAAEGLARALDAGDRHVLDEEVRRQHDRAGHARRGSAPRSSSAIEPPSLWPNSQGGSRRCASASQQRRQHFVRLAVHEVDAPALVGRARRRAAVAGARIDQAAAAGRVAQLAREVAPHRARAQAFVQEDEQRRAARARGAIHSCSMRTRRPRQSRSTNSTRHAGLRRSCSRSLKRWILPVAVFGSSATNSICRGYL